MARLLPNTTILAIQTTRGQTESMQQTVAAATLNTPVLTSTKTQGRQSMITLYGTAEELANVQQTILQNRRFPEHK